MVWTLEPAVERSAVDFNCPRLHGVASSAEFQKYQVQDEKSRGPRAPKI
jgi:hypothetical protein